MSGRSGKLASSNARRLRSTITRVEQQPYDTTPDRRAPRIAASGMVLGLCRLTSSLGPATGTWPSLTPTSQASIAIYQDVAGTLTTSITATVYNWRNVTWATGKTTLVGQWPGGRWFVIDQDC